MAEETLLSPDDAVDVLEELLPAQNKSYELGLKFKLQQYEVESIHSMYSNPRTRLLHILIEFTNQTERRPTCGVIVEALRSPAVNLPALASKVEAAHPPTPPLSSNVVPETTATESAPTGTTAACDDEVKSKPFPQMKSVTGRPKSVNEVRGEIKSFRRRFDSMKESTIEYLDRFKIAVMAVACMLTSIEALDEHEVFLRDNHEKMHRCKQHWELFGWLNFYWNYLAYDLLYQLLEVLSLREDSFTDLLERMEAYKGDLWQFRRSTPLEVFCQAEPHRETDPPPDFRKMVVEHNWPRSVTLEDVEVFRRRLEQTYNLKRCAVMVKSVRRGSFVVTWFVHVSAVKVLKMGGRVDILKEFSITRLEIDGSCIYPHTPTPSQTPTPFSTASLSLTDSTAIERDPPKASAEEEDYPFSAQPSDDIFCPVMMCLLLQPHLTSCCGNHLSREAVARIQRERGACPLCKKENWSTVLNKHFQRQVNSLHVFCRYKERGCGWEGEVGGYHSHVESCPKRKSTNIIKSTSSVVHLKYRKIHFSELQFDGEHMERGTYGDVRKAVWQDKSVAVKMFPPGQRKGGFSEELVCLSVLQGHPNIVALYGANVGHSQTNLPFLVEEYAPYSLEKVLHTCQAKLKYAIENVMSWVIQLATALEFIHSQKILHRDVKPSNILLFDDGRVLKFCDFGTARKLDHTLTNAVGTVWYMAPEVIRGTRYTASCDVYSFRIVLWEMITRHKPYLSGTRGRTMAPQSVLYRIATGWFKFMSLLMFLTLVFFCKVGPPMIAGLPKCLEELIQRCWDEGPHKRPTTLEIKTKLERLVRMLNIDTGRPFIVQILG